MKIPFFSLLASNGKIYTEKYFSSGSFVLFLYPKDMTPGCTAEACDFRDTYQNFQEIGVSVFGLSKDPLSLHEKFSEKYALPFPLFSDENVVLITALGAWKEKSMYGKKYMGTDRSTFVIQNGKIMHEWRKVKVSGHAQEVFDFIKKQKGL